MQSSACTLAHRAALPPTSHAAIIDAEAPNPVSNPRPFPSPEKLRSRDILRLLTRTWPFIRPYKRHLLYLWLVVLPGAAAGLMGLYVLPIFFDVVGNGHPLTPGQARL